MAYNVLIVDDSTTMRALIRKVLHMSGFNIGEYHEGGNGQEALAILQGHWIDVILTDLHMPEMSGPELVAALKNNPFLQGIPVVLITTEARPEVLGPLVDQGISGYIKKPFHPEEIKQKLKLIMGEAGGPDDRTLEGCDF